MRGNGSRSILATFSALLLLTSLAAAKTKKAIHKHASAAHHSSRHVSSSHSRHSRGGRHSRKMAWKYRGQQRPDAERTRAIQEALVRQNYLHGTPSGVWDQMTRDAMARFQEDHGWQTRMVPDSRALIALGLGPSKDGLINPETAMTSAPPDAGAGDRDSSTGTSFRQ
ncbi:MAG TPA: peptidoglycan-binding domain-containing protein [Terriglobales bacterium]|nr:peptidoglycan-binding domain-containing protein [Terriglobales bacterium]